MPIPGLKPKDLVGIPWRVALALQADGWWLRSDIVWNKPNPMPESIKDRPTKAHEYIFLLAKSERYFYDADAIREPHTYGQGGGHHRNVLNAPESHAPGRTPHTGIRKSPNRVPSGWDTGPGNHHQATGRYKTSGPGPHVGGRRQAPKPGEPCAFHPLGRNKRSVWTITTQPYPGSHFATFPEEIPRLCILAGSRPGDIVLDPFGGSGTTSKVALELGRRAVHVDLTYHDLAKKRMTTTPAMAGLMR
jgi:DNA modification methylase